MFVLAHRCLPSVCAIVLAACGTTPPSEHDSESESDSNSSPSPAKCGDGRHETGEVCYERIETGRSDTRAFGVMLVRDGKPREQLVLVSLPETGTDATVELAEIGDCQGS